MRVIGVGNLLLSDEGIGIHVVRELERRQALPGVELVDGGVAGAGLLGLIEGEKKVVLIDAVAAPLPPGTVLRLFPEDLRRGSAVKASLHDLNLADAIDLMRMRDTLPETLLLGIVPADIGSWSMELSAPLAGRFEEILEKVSGEISRFFGLHEKF
ncbi:MAG: HyaD/HybD family hydrogenase maturation endopeptidase [Deltaproteobacteria bacterium]